MRVADITLTGMITTCSGLAEGTGGKAILLLTDTGSKVTHMNITERYSLIDKCMYNMQVNQLHQLCQTGKTPTHWKHMDHYPSTVSRGQHHNTYDR